MLETEDGGGTEGECTVVVKCGSENEAGLHEGKERERSDCEIVP
jgi:hypothetical protein